MRTSVNLRDIDIPNLVASADKCKIGNSVLICLCLRKFFAAHPLRLKSSLVNHLVEYQPKGAGYCITNIVFDVDVYNIAVNFRVFCRLSVSKMVTIALGLYLDEVVWEFKNKGKISHNYVDYKHHMRHNDMENLGLWTVTWQVEKTNVKKRGENSKD